tara:strand:+ start:88 stop:294 length:207 start_codon:yes stop_codon:yes gene_type:complete
MRIDAPVEYALGRTMLEVLIEMQRDGDELISITGSGEEQRVLVVVARGPWAELLERALLVLEEPEGTA